MGHGASLNPNFPYGNHRRRRLGHDEEKTRNLKHVKDRATPSGQFGDEDHVDLASLRQRQDLLAFGVLLLCPEGDFLPDPADLEVILVYSTAPGRELVMAAENRRAIESRQRLTPRSAQ